MQELTLRHRARTMLIVCPAGLTLQWREEMRDKFGLDFRIVNTALLKEVRRSRGLYANPWTHYPRLIVSVDWLKRDRPLRLLREILPAVPRYPRTFDVLVVDVCPAGARQVRDRLASHPGDPDTSAALRAPAFPLGDSAQRLSGVVHRAARDARWQPFRAQRQAGAVITVSGHHRLRWSISLVIRGSGTTQSGTPGTVIFAARIGTPAATAGSLARAATRPATSVAIGTTRLPPGQRPDGPPASRTRRPRSVQAHLPLAVHIHIPPANGIPGGHEGT
jgi:hypothetical protein